MNLYNAATTLTNTILAGNTVTGSLEASDIVGEDCSVSGDNNIVAADASGGLVNGQNGNIILTSLTDLHLAPLGNYGGPNQTMALLPGSTAIGMGVGVSGVTSDERGVPLGTVVDIGAFQTSLFVESSSGSVNTTSAGLTLPGAVSLADQFAGEEISFDPSGFALAETITLSSTLELDNPVLSTTISGPAVGVTVDGNDASQDIGILNASVSLFGLTITAGDRFATLNSDAGGGVGNLGTLVMTDCTVTGDSDGVNGGGLYNNGTATLVNCRFSDDSAGSTGGAIFNDSGAVTLTDCTISNNSSASHGGGISNYGSLSLTGCTVSGNTAVSGSGGGLRGLGTIALIDSTISGNSASYAGGGVSTGGTITLTGCTISGNSAGHYGGGISNVGPATLADCTISGNSAADAGGGLFNYGSTGTLTATTISGNIAKVGAGIYVKSGAVVMTDTIVAGNSTALLVPSDVAVKNSESGNIAAGSSASISGNSNLIGTGGSGGLENGANGNIVLNSLMNLGLASLGNYGGPTETMALLPGSPALGEGTAVSGIGSDQRGLALAATLDIGAFQSQGFVLTVVSGGTPQSAYGGLSFGKALSVQVVANNPIEPVAGGAVVFSVPASGASAVLSPNTAVIGDDGVASVNATAGLTRGSFTVTASSIGASGAGLFGLTNLEVTLALTASATNLVFGQPVTLSATGGLAGGGVTFFLGSTELGSSIVDAAATATLTVASLPVGTGSITASYAGDSPTPAFAETAPLDVTVAKAGSKITLGAIEVLKRRNLSAAILDVDVTGVAPSVSGVPTGTVTFELVGRGKKKKAKVLGVKLLSDGMTVLPVKAKVVGKMPLQIYYGGDVDYLASSVTAVISKRSLVL